MTPSASRRPKNTFSGGVGGRGVVSGSGVRGSGVGVESGLVDKPVIGVPTSVGYGANMQGMSALLTMINSCAEGVSVVNIDNGFGAGYMAAQINRLAIGAGKE